MVSYLHDGLLQRQILIADDRTGPTGTKKMLCLLCNNFIIICSEICLYIDHRGQLFVFIDNVTKKMLPVIPKDVSSGNG